MRNHAKKPTENRTVSPNPKVYGPKNLKREISTRNQKRFDEDTLIYGENDALPLIIAKAVDESPAATSCIDTVAQFIKGSGFSDKDLMDYVIDKDGTTLWDFHCGLAESCALFWGFSVNFKFNEKLKITNAYQLSFESVRFKKPDEKTPYINTVKYNPYFGTDDYNHDFTTEYPIFDLKALPGQISGFKSVKDKQAFNGQVYYYGKTSPLYRFYPVPKYWSAKEAIRADHKLQEFHDQELENGFFQSVLMNVIGDPSAMSKNPDLMKEELAADGVTKIKKPTKTVGQEFNDQMANAFSGSSKAGTAMVLWAANKDQLTTVAPFPTGINGDRIIATQNSITKTITIATKVPSILANISEGVSLGSDGNEMQKAIELMQSRTAEWRERLMNFYNKILIPNLEKGPKAKVEIVNYNPITQEVKFDKQYWEALTSEEKRGFIRANFPNVKLSETVPVTEVNPETGESVAPLPGEDIDQSAQVKPNEALKNLKIADLNKIQKIVARYNLSLSDPNNSKSITYEQAKQMLSSYGFTEEELNAWLVTPEEI